MRRFWIVVGVLGLMALGLSACGAGGAGTEAAASTSSEHAHALPTGEIPLFDLQFLDGMVAHHAGAVAMAEIVLQEAEHQELRDFAQAILDLQSTEIEQMRAWREEWYGTAPPTAGMSMDMGAMEIPEDPAKPFDQRFLEAMISHHVGALDMAQLAGEQAQHDELHTFADAIVAAQSAEIETMRGWLRDWYGVQ